MTRPKRAPAPGASTFAAAVGAVTQVVVEGRSADDALGEAAERPDRSAVRAIALGTLRWYWRLQPAIATLIDRPFAELSPPLGPLLVCAAHQVTYARSPTQTSAHLAVEATRLLGVGHASGFVNAVLRKYVAQRDAILAQVDQDLAVRTAHPRWLVERLQAAWPDDAAGVLEANNQHPPMMLRVDVSQRTVEQFLTELRASGRNGVALEWLPGAVMLERPQPVTSLPGFGEGQVSVQDAAAQIAAHLLAPVPGNRVLDVCAAPGGKTTHIAELGGDLAALVAVDSDAQRLALVETGLARSGRRASLLVGDCRAALPGLAADSFDRVLVDAPCSATGVVRRHPDIKLLRRDADIGPLTVTQAAVLRTAFETLKPGGRLVYATCSVLPDENEAVVSAFLTAEPRARLLPWPEAVQQPPGALIRECGVQLLPGRGAANCDGFYYACLTKA